MTKKFFDGLGNLAEIAVGIGLIVRGYSKFRANGSAMPLGYAAQQPLFERDKNGRMAPVMNKGSIVDNAVFKEVRNIDERVGYIRQAIRRDSLSPVIKEAALKVLTRKCGEEWCVPEKNYLGEICALFYAVKNPRSPIALRYVRDHPDVDQFSSAEKLMKLGGGDCFPEKTLLLRRDGSLVPIKDIEIGDEIWGYGDWTRVVNKWAKGVLDTWGIKLSNGCHGRLTPSHKLWIRQPVIHRINVSEAVPGLQVLQPTLVPGAVGGTIPPWWWKLHKTARGPIGPLTIDTISFDSIRLNCFDIATEDHHVYLPEGDWTVSNCDDATIYLGSLLHSVGYPVRLRIIQDVKSSTWSHIYLRCGAPPQNPNKWIPLDTTVKTSRPGWEVPGAEESAQTKQPAGLVTRVKDYDV